MRAESKKKFSNRPKHIKINDSIYFFTVRTIEGQWFLRPDEYKRIVLEKIIEKSKKFNYSLLAYVILANHYHFMAKIGDGSNIAKFIGEINGASAHEINKMDNVTSRKIWWNYFDYCIRDEADFYKHLNYIHQNPIKHGVSRSFEYEFSSYQQWLKEKGDEYMNDVLEKYPIVDFVSLMDAF